jgi:Phage integrase, N-terminal SAM-like domain
MKTVHPLSQRHLAEMGEQEVTSFLTYLAVNRNVSASTQNQALAPILFLCKEVLKQPIPWGLRSPLDSLAHLQPTLIDTRFRVRLRALFIRQAGRHVRHVLAS